MCLPAPAGVPSNRPARTCWPTDVVPAGTRKLSPVTNTG
jgi:hypothetical protein